MNQPSFGTAPARKLRIDEQPGEQEDPVGERVQPRERHVARADQQREQVDREPRQHRQRVEEDHRDAVHREELVVLLRRQQRLVRLRQLKAHDQRLDAAEDQEHEGRDDVAHAERLVIDGAEPAVEPGRRAPKARFSRSRRSVGDVADLRLLRVLAGRSLTSRHLVVASPVAADPGRPSACPPSPSGRRRARPARRLGLAVPAVRRSSGGIGDQKQRHVARAAGRNIRCIARDRCRRVGAQPGNVLLAGDEVGLAGEKRNPERVDHVGRPQDQLDGTADGHVHLVGRLDEDRAVPALIGHTPPPLMAGDVDGRGGRRAGARGYRPARRWSRRQRPPASRPSVASPKCIQGIARSSCTRAIEPVSVRMSSTCRAGRTAMTTSTAIVRTIITARTRSPITSQ